MLSTLFSWWKKVNKLNFWLKSIIISPTPSISYKVHLVLKYIKNLEQWDPKFTSFTSFSPKSHQVNYFALKKLIRCLILSRVNFHFIFSSSFHLRIKTQRIYQKIWVWNFYHMLQCKNNTFTSYFFFLSKHFHNLCSKGLELFHPILKTYPCYFNWLQRHIFHMLPLYYQW